MTVGEKVERLEKGTRARSKRDPTKPAGQATGAEGDPGQDEFCEMIEGYPDSFWQAVEDGAIEEPALMAWNEWQTWRKTDGGLPKGVRGSNEQKREVALWRAAMSHYHGATTVNG